MKVTSGQPEPHLLDLWVEYLPGGLLKPVKIHGTMKENRGIRVRVGVDIHRIPRQRIWPVSQEWLSLLPVGDYDLTEVFV